MPRLLPRSAKVLTGKVLAQSISWALPHNVAARLGWAITSFPVSGKMPCIAAAKVGSHKRWAACSMLCKAFWLARPSGQHRTWSRLAVVLCIIRQLALQLALAPSGLNPVTVCFHRPQTPTLGTKYILDLLKRALCSLGAALRARIGGDNMGTAVGQLVGQTMRRDAVTPPEPSRRAQQRTTQPKRPGQSTQAVRPRLVGSRTAPFHSL